MPVSLHREKGAFLGGGGILTARARDNEGKNGESLERNR